MATLSREEREVKTQAQPNNLLPRCYICNEVPSMGIRDGFLLAGQFICIFCEEKILNLSYNDPAYHAMVEKLRKAINKKKHGY